MTTQHNLSATLWSKLGLGTGTLASLGRAAKITDVRQIISSMLDCSAKVIDTADTYGSGDCERLLGRVLREERDAFTLVTKAGYRHANLPGPLGPLNQVIKKGIQRFVKKPNFDPTYLVACLDNSLARLKTDRVEAFLLHDASLESVTDESVLSECVKFRKSGKTRLVGISSESPEVLSAAIASGVFSVIESPANLMVIEAMRPVWQEAEARGIHVIGNHVFSPTCLRLPGITHEQLMRASVALLPKSSTVLCGTRNSRHFTQTNEWANDPLPSVEAEKLLFNLGNLI
ncbi:aldo/keto reductase [Coraliomargarita sp. SDUM461004]|uniref:Aldo/keto reductase n=1 Tax=Thalassobacterium sedimentorum TaxID=3041258 RepID=A0ABU1AMA4_9BACT|nr:aldo/keto reductase [Coraliomargarita sp. SDUM461004]MDQ8195932.1 aldo/keto reductase [Coraliomargarita sp. SDUM461004]